VHLCTRFITVPHKSVLILIKRMESRKCSSLVWCDSWDYENFPPFVILSKLVLRVDTFRVKYLRPSVGSKGISRQEWNQVITEATKLVIFVLFIGLSSGSSNNSTCGMWNEKELHHVQSKPDNEQVSVLTQLYIYVSIRSYMYALQTHEVYSYINGIIKNISERQKRI
jgi:hypothetical protein